VIIHYGKSHVQAAQTAEEIRRLGRQVALVQADLNDPCQVSTLIERAQALGPLSGLINNASIFEDLDWRTTRLEDWNRHLMVNLTAPFLLSQAFACHLKEGRTGKIVNLLDWRALRPGPDHLPYTISKTALAGLTRALAQALAPHIQVNGVALGAILPPSDGGDPEAAIRNVPAGRWAKLEEVDQTVLFLLDGPTYITGEILHVDGGRHLV
jgi:NAD(P)-dependent dehydrogenase (short-subunit alcohol dehydrogenase family)